MTILQSIEKNGARGTARLLVSAKIKMLTMDMVTLADMPDNYEITQLVDELQDLLESDPGNKAEIKTALSVINDDFLINNIMS